MITDYYVRNAIEEMARKGEETYYINSSRPLSVRVDDDFRFPNTNSARYSGYNPVRITGTPGSPFDIIPEFHIRSSNQISFSSNDSFEFTFPKRYNIIETRNPIRISSTHTFVNKFGFMGKTFDKPHFEISSGNGINLGLHQAPISTNLGFTIRRSEQFPVPPRSRDYAFDTQLSLRDAAWKSSPEVHDALLRSGSRLQLMDEGTEYYPALFDSYFLPIDKMPGGMDESTFVEMWGSDITKTVGSFWFDRLGVFRRREAGRPLAVGDIYDIDMVGPDDASVMIVDKTPFSFSFAGISNPKTGHHIETGAREFGIRKDASGVPGLYIIGASKPRHWIYGFGGIGPWSQTQFLSLMLQGLCAKINYLGGLCYTENLRYKKDLGFPRIRR